MRLILALLLMFPMVTFGAARTLSDCTNLPAAGSPPTEAAPYDLDNCTINEGDEITGILTGAQSRWGSVALRAPSKTVGVTSSPIAFTASTVVFLEDQSAQNRLTITLVNASTSAIKLWSFSNIVLVKIGGPNLSITFVGNHPGLANGESQEYQGLIYLTPSNTGGTADIRANFTNAATAGIRVVGGDLNASGEVTTGYLNNLNVAGVFLNAGMLVNGGVKELWVDPDRTVVMDPYVIQQGWDGTVGQTLGDGTKLGCIRPQDEANNRGAQVRTGVSFGMVNVWKVTGGVTLKYGTINANIFVTKYIGNGPNDRYHIRFSEWGRSGPTAITGKPEGVLVKSWVFGGLMKHDPLWAYSFTSASGRWLLFQEVPSTYANGWWPNPVSGCSDTVSNNYNTSAQYLWFPEASHDGQQTTFQTAYIDAKFDRLSVWYGMGSTGAFIKGVDYGQDAGDRTWGHVIRAASGTRVPHTALMMDTMTATGPGSWNRLDISPFGTEGGTLTPINNTVTNTRVHGTVVVGNGAAGTTISNVDFRGDAARAIFSVGSGATVTVSNICARAGSTITGAGTVIYEGATWKNAGSPATYTISADMTECNITEDGIPNPPGAP